MATFLRDVTQDVNNRRAAVRRRSTKGIVILAGGDRLQIKLADISDTGARIVACPELGRLDQFIMEFEDRASVQANIIWRKDGFAGVRFDQPIDSLVDKHAA